ncbi:MAG: phosphohydrolase [Treponema sp.]|nr:phosphohydrolase [Treponema sp.]
MDEFNRVDVATIKAGVCFSAPVFFEDGKNMFLAAGMKAKPYHIRALKQWNIPYLLTKGHPITPQEASIVIARMRDKSVQEVEYLG